MEVTDVNLYGKDPNKPKDNQKNEPVIEKVEGVSAIVQKKTLGEKFRSALVNEDIKDIKNYVLFDVFIPVMKQAISQFFTRTINDIFGTSIAAPNITASANPIKNITPYSKMSTQAPVQRSAGDYDNIILSSIEEVEAVYTYLNGILEEYHRVRVADLFQAVGLTAPYTCQNYGWRDLSNATSRRVMLEGGNFGYKLVLPKASYINA